MIFYILSLYIMYLGVKNFKKGFISFLAFSLLLNSNVTFLTIVPFSTLLAVYFNILFWMNKKRNSFTHAKFPWRLPFLLMTISMVISSIFSISGFSSELTTLLGNLTKEILLIYVIWKTIETKDDFRLLFRYITYIMFFSCIYAVVELLLQKNLISMYTQTLTSESKVRDWSYDTGSRGYRVYSIFEHAIGAGANWALYSIFVFYLYITNKELLKPKKLSLITAAMCIPCILFTRMRSPIVFFVICALCLLQLNNKKFYKFIPIVVVLGVLAIPFVINNINIITSIFQSKEHSTVGGSSFALRLQQFSTAVNLMKKSPVIGLGTQYMSVLPTSETYWMFGSESVLLQIPPRYGLLGIVAYLIKIFYEVWVLPKKYKSKQIFIISLAYWVLRIITSIPGFCLILYYLFLFYLIKNSSTYKSRVEKI